MPENTEIRLGEPYPLVEADNVKSTKERIMLEATIMFACKGYAAVSVRDIAQKINIKAASIYSHFASKEDLWNAVLEHIKELYLLYFDRLIDAVRQASNFEEVLDCMFFELKQTVNIFTYYGFSLIQTEQFRDEKAYEIYSEILLKYSIGCLKNEFDICIQKGWAKPFDTKATAAFFMHSVLNGILLRTHEDMKRRLPYDVNEMFAKLQEFILQTGKK